MYSHTHAPTDMQGSTILGRRTNSLHDMSVDEYASPGSTRDPLHFGPWIGGFAPHGMCYAHQHSTRKTPWFVRRAGQDEES